MRRFAIVSLWAVLALGSRAARAEVFLVMDPSPPFSGVLEFGDFAEGAPGANEDYAFTGRARNDASSSRRLVVRAKANGVVVAGSEHTFVLAPASGTDLSYDFKLSSHPATVGLQFEALDGTVASVNGVFRAQPFAAATPAAATPATGVLASGALALAMLVIAMRSVARARDFSTPT